MVFSLEGGPEAGRRTPVSNRTGLARQGLRPSPLEGLAFGAPARYSTPVRQLLRNRILLPLQAQLTQGVSPSRLALALSLGLVVGVIPVLGVTTALCALLAVALRLNQPAIQLANYLAGAWLFGRPPIAFGLGQLQAELTADALGTIGHYLVDNLRALAAWGLLAPLLGGLLYLLLQAALSRLPLPRADAPGAG
jgi:uncharacterized protein (DUF2062 family)